MPQPIQHWKNPSVQEKFHSPNVHTSQWLLRAVSPEKKELVCLYLVPQSRINGTTPPLTLYGFIVFNGTAFTPPYYSLLSRICFDRRD